MLDLTGQRAISEFENPQCTDSMWVNGAIESMHDFLRLTLPLLVSRARQCIDIVI